LFGTSDNSSVPSSLVHLTVSGGEIEMGAFSGLPNLTDFSLSDKITRIHPSAFDGSEAEIETQNGLTTFDGWILSNLDSSRTSISFPASTKGVADGVFENCTSLTSVSFPATVKSLGEDAFSGCSSLSSVTFADGGVEYIGEGCFSFCPSITSIALPDSLNYIGFGAFEYENYFLSSLESLSIPFVGRTRNTSDSSTWYLGYIFGAPVESDPAFFIPPSLTSVTLTACDVVPTAAFYNCLYIRFVTLYNCREIQAYAFAGCNNLRTLFVDSSSTRIDENAITEEECPLFEDIIYLEGI
jgi:hypothetical protein